MHKLRHGDILFCKRNSLISKGIRLFTNSKITHVALVVMLGDIPFIIDAQKDGVNLRTYDSWMEEFNYQYHIVRYNYHNELTSAELLYKALSRAGKAKYDFFSLLVRQPIYILFDKWIGSSESPKRFYCSDYVAWVYLKALSIDIYKEYWKLSPAEMYTLSVESNKFSLIS